MSLEAVLCWQGLLIPDMADVGRNLSEVVYEIRSHRGQRVSLRHWQGRERSAVNRFFFLAMMFYVVRGPVSSETRGNFT